MNVIQVTMAGKMTVKKVQDKFNLYVRLRDTKNGTEKVKCISCHTMLTLGKNMNASHYYPAGKFKSLRFEEDNCHVACIKCNKWEHGNLIPYRFGLMEKIGGERLARLDLLASQSKKSLWKPAEYELQYLYDEIKAKIKTL